jgi:carbon-monoxide dehydrogenase medium subunit
MKLRLAQPEHLVDLGAVAELKGISVGAGEIEIGAMTTQHELISSKELAAACPIIAETSHLISDPQVRYVGTIGGNVANGDPGNDMPALMQCLDATFVIENTGGSREVKAREFYHGIYETALQDGDLLTSVRIPKPAQGHGYAYTKMKRKVGDYATAAAAVILDMNGNTCNSASIALTNVGDTALYAAEASDSLAGSDLGADAVDRAVKLAEAITNPVADMRGSEEYRTRMAGIMVRRGIEQAAARAS